MNWTLTPDQFALAWERTDGDRIPYPLAVRLSARDTAERAAQLPALVEWCDRVLDADLEAALRVLARPTVRLEVYGEQHPVARGLDRPATPLESFSPTQVLGADPGYDPPVAGIGGSSAPPRPVLTPGVARRPLAPGPTLPVAASTDEPADGEPRPVRVLGACAGHIAVVAAQRPGAVPDRGGDIRLYVGGPKSLAARVISVLPEIPMGTNPAVRAPLPRVREDSRDLVTVPVAGPTAPARIRRLLGHPRMGIGQIVVSARRPDGNLHPFGVLCWIDVMSDGRYAIRTGTDVEVTPVDAEAFAAQLRPMLNAAGRTGADAERH
ncbi:ESX secretion-associated protein EspG [Nocardia arizonensis]|uniref:ESX secretion-associated protein EspG n=1 Tax=Nocardia arizonensis TaxID=1141647 RepID=UPI0006CFEDBD|nr:ESX secretion-associated protein EspG [Nocardia arizonensis]